MDSAADIRKRVQERMAGGTTTATPKPKTKARKPATPKPPNTVTPGWIHRAIAVKILKTLRDNSEVAFGRPIDVGELPETEDLAREGGIIDDRPPVELLSRIVAHIFHRTPGLSKVEKRMEGTQRSSGIMSDISALCAQIYARNESLIKEATAQAKAQKAAKNNGGHVPVQ